MYYLVAIAIECHIDYDCIMVTIITVYQIVYSVYGEQYTL